MDPPHGSDGTAPDSRERIILTQRELYRTNVVVQLVTKEGEKGVTLTILPALNPRPLSGDRRGRGSSADHRIMRGHVSLRKVTNDEQGGADDLRFFLRKDMGAVKVAWVCYLMNDKGELVSPDDFGLRIFLYDTQNDRNNKRLKPTEYKKGGSEAKLFNYQYTVLKIAKTKTFIEFDPLMTVSEHAPLGTYRMILRVVDWPFMRSRLALGAEDAANLRVLHENFIEFKILPQRDGPSAPVTSAKMKRPDVNFPQALDVQPNIDSMQKVVDDLAKADAEQKFKEVQDALEEHIHNVATAKNPREEIKKTDRFGLSRIDNNRFYGYIPKDLIGVENLRLVPLEDFVFGQDSSKPRMLGFKWNGKDTELATRGIGKEKFFDLLFHEKVERVQEMQRLLAEKKKELETFTSQMNEFKQSVQSAAEALPEGSDKLLGLYVKMEGTAQDMLKLLEKSSVLSHVKDAAGILETGEGSFKDEISQRLEDWKHATSERWERAGKNMSNVYKKEFYDQISGSLLTVLKDLKNLNTKMKGLNKTLDQQKKDFEQSFS
ncbi:TPA: hypothetical protein HA265_03935 [Candidatus Woesearchaeota archaeon]|nr:hypothetical protein [Candidatus Woesearchaeota archaeon]